MFKSILCFIFMVSFAGCGRSPFLNDSPAKKNNDSQVGSSNQSELIFDIPSSSRNGQRGGEARTDKYNFTGLWQVGPKTGTANSLIVVITDMQGTRADAPFNLSSYLWMPDMGHGSSPIKIVKLGTGLYELSNIWFVMGGMWNLHFEFKNGDQLYEEVVWDLEL